MDRHGVSLVIKRLEGDDLKILEPILAERGWPSLNGTTCTAFCAFDGAELVGFHVVQLFPHAEPLWVAPKYRGSPLTEDLVRRTVDFLRESDCRGFMVIADSPYVEAFCTSNGMKRVTSPVYIKAG